MEKHLKISEIKKKDILKILDIIIRLYKAGKLGGDIMPEDANPNLPNNTSENYLYFTLPMALNYQRNSYKLWEAANNTFNDKNTIDVFYPEKVIIMDINILKDKLLKYKLALQPNKHPQIWMELCNTFFKYFNSNVNQFFMENNCEISKIKKYMLNNKKRFPYLSGTKIMNYWLYVIEQYTDIIFIDRQNITVAPDTHILQASVKLGIIEKKDIENKNIREIVSEIWEYILKGTNLCPIDIHTPLWLWSRGNFTIEIDNFNMET